MHAALGKRLAILATLALAIAPARAADPVLYVRVVQIKASGQRAAQKPADLDRDLEPLRAHLEQLPLKFARFEFLETTVKHGADGKGLAFDLQKPYKATATPSIDGERLKLVLLVKKVLPPDPEKAKDAKASPEPPQEETVFETVTSLKDSATTVQAIGGGVEGGHLLLAVTVSKESL